MKLLTCRWIPVLLVGLLLQGCGMAMPSLSMPRISLPSMPWSGEAGEDAAETPAEPAAESPDEADAAPASEDEPEVAADKTVYRLKPNDPLAVRLRAIPTEQVLDETVDEHGYIQLPYLDPMVAAEKSASQLEKEIRQAYLDARIYREDLTVSVMVPTQSYFVRGEVKSPGRYPLSGGVTIVQAIATAGGYTQFASGRRVRLLRGDDVIRINVDRVEDHPEEDRELQPGDVIVVPRSFF